MPISRDSEGKFSSGGGGRSSAIAARNRKIDSIAAKYNAGSGAQRMRDDSARRSAEIKAWRAERRAKMKG